MKDQIIDVEGKPIKACFQFYYKNYLVSCSQIMTKYLEVCIFDCENNLIETDFNLTEVQEAIEYINNI